jgi:hypothetical protein
MAFLSKLIDRMKPSSSPTLEPNYTESQAALLHRVPEYTVAASAIKATDVPQWVWTNAQCKEWLFAVCYDSLGISPKVSKEIAEK